MLKSRSWPTTVRFLRGVVGTLAIGALAGCHLDMWNQPKYKTLAASPFFSDGSSARPLVEGVVPYMSSRVGNPLYTGVNPDGTFLGEVPIPVDAALLERGRQRFDVFCAQCHGRTGQANGMIVQRGMKKPVSFHDPRVKGMPHGYFFDVMTNGFGVMYSYAARITPEDRWAITAYIRALQLSQDARIQDVPEVHREELMNPTEAPADADAHGGESDDGH